MNLDMSWWLPTPETSIAEAALRYVEHGFNPVPIYPDKPTIAVYGSPSIRRVRRWFVSVDPSPGVGWLLYGTTPEYLALAIEGEDGQRSLVHHEERMGTLPCTLSCTAGGLTYRFFQGCLLNPETIQLGPGLSIVPYRVALPVPPTRNDAGDPWTWTNTTIPHPLPQEWLSALMRRSSKQQPKTPEIVVPKTRSTRTNNGANWRNARPGDPCPVCSGDSNCTMSNDGCVVCCRREPSGDSRVASDGRQYWVHTLRASVTPRPKEIPPPRAPLEVLHTVYSSILQLLPLADTHLKDLIKRGLDEDQITLRQYRTLPSDLVQREDVAASVVGIAGEDPAHIPGIYMFNGRWILGGPAGMIIPCRDLSGNIFSLKVRTDQTIKDQRYFYVSSVSKRNSQKGPSAISGVHVPLFSGDRSEVRITEGEIKADVCTALSNVLTLSIPGANSYLSILPVLDQLRPKHVRVAFDADFRTKKEVRQSLYALVHCLEAEGYSNEVETWDARFGKGLDDVFAGAS